uniref:Uncharacterized protein n=1 Tax=viral metagenome TaxID=1070528 RepID=A0A6C0K233_9ZZZZ
MGQTYGIQKEAYEKWVEAKDLEVGTCYRQGHNTDGLDYYGRVLKRSAVKKGKGLSGERVVISWENGHTGSHAAHSLFMQCPCRSKKRNKTKKRRSK